MKAIKVFLGAFLAVLIFSGSCRAFDFTATWTHNGVGNLGFKIYQLDKETLKRIREIVVEGANTSVATIIGAPDDAISWWVCTAYSSTEISGPSNVLVIDPISGKSAPYINFIRVALDVGKLDDEQYRLEKLREIEILEEERIRNLAS